MKKVLSISLGSSKRNHKVETTILNKKISIERIGTDGSRKKAIKLFRELDGKYDAFGLGGMDIYIYTAGKKYQIRESKKIIKNAKRTPVVDGSGLKNTLERNVLNNLHNENIIKFDNKTVLLVSAVDRFGMAETFTELGANILIADFLFILGIPLILKSMTSFEKIARIVAPMVTKLPFRLLYPTGNKQNSSKVRKKYIKYYKGADIIAGDFHLIKRYLPDKIEGKIIITNTVSGGDIKTLRKHRIDKLITTTPELAGRSFGTNVMEAVLVALAEKKPQEITSAEYNELLHKIDFKPRIVKF